jgi:pyruvate dehydrogenase E1 component beta subunit
MVQLAVKAARDLSHEGISTSVIDLRTLVPLDRDGLAAEAARVSNVLVVDEDYRDYGMTAEVIASVVERIGRDAPRMARHAMQVPQPASRVLEEEVVPSAASIMEAARTLVRA